MNKNLIPLSFVLILILSCCKLVNTMSFQQQAESIKILTKDSIVTIPFKVVDNKIILSMKIEIEGKIVERDFLFDSGGFTLFYSKNASDDSLPIKELKHAMDIPISTGTQQTYTKVKYVDNVLFSIKNYKFYKEKVPVIDLSKKKNYLGIVGMDIFIGYFVEIDFKNNCIVLSRQKNEIKNNYSNTLKLKVKNNQRPYIQNLSINGITSNSLIDLGYSGYVLVQVPQKSKFNRVLNNNFCGYISNIAIVSDYTKTNLYQDTFYSSYINTVSQNDQKIVGVTGDITVIINPYKNFKSNIGIAFLRRNFEKIGFDMKNELFYYTLNSHQKISPINCNEVSFYKENDTIKIKRIMINSKWYREGLRPCFTILKINSMDAKEYIKSRNEEIVSLETIDCAGLIKLFTK